MSEYYGLYQGIVLDNNDPASRGRVILQVPQVFGDAATNWCAPNLPTISKPAIREVVYVQFINGDPAKPIYHSAQAVEAENIVAGSITAESLDFTPATGEDVQAAVEAAQLAAAAAGKSIQTQKAAAAPTTRADGSALTDGDLWIDTAHGNRINRWDTTTAPASWAALTVGLAALGNDVTARALGSITTYYQNTKPSLATAKNGDLWIDTSLDANGVSLKKLWRFDSTANDFVPSEDARLQQALTAAGTAKAIADGKIVTYVSAGPPAGPPGVTLSFGLGDLWIDTANGNLVNRWDTSLTPAAWVPFSFGTNAIAPGAIIGTHITDEAITTPKIKTGSITADRLASLLVLGATISTRTLADDNKTLIGGGVDITGAGLSTYDDAGNKRVDLPNVGTDYFRGNADIDNLTTVLTATLKDTSLVPGSVLSLQSSVAAPTNPPTYSINYTTVQHTDDGLWSDRQGITSDGTNWYTVRTVSPGYVVEKWNASGTLISSHTESPAGRALVPFGVICVGTTLYMLHWDNLVGYWGVVQYTTALVRGSTAYLTTSGPEGYGPGRGAAIGYDPIGSGTAQNPVPEFIIAQSRTTNGDKVRFQRYTISGTTATPTTSRDTSFAYPYWIGHVHYGAYDFGAGAPKYVFGNYGSSSYQVANATTGAQETSTYGWDNPTSGNQGMWYDGANFWAVSHTGLRYKFETGNQWTDSADATWWASYTWRNAVTPAETTVTKPVKITMKKRAQIQVFTPAPPLGVTEARIYFAKGATAPDVTPPLQNMKLAGSTSGISQQSRTDTNVLFGPPNDNPTGNNFPASGTPASLVSTEVGGPRINLKGDGSGRVGPWSWDASGNMLTQPTQPSDSSKQDAVLTNRRTTDFSTTSASYVSAGFSIVLQPGTYLYRVRGTYQSSATATGIGLRNGGTATVSDLRGESIIYGGTNSSTSPVYTRVITGQGQAVSATTGVQAANTSYPFTMEGYVVVTASGSISVDVCSQDGVGTVRIMTGSMLTATKIA